MQSSFTNFEFRNTYRSSVIKFELPQTKSPCFRTSMALEGQPRSIAFFSIAFSMSGSSSIIGISTCSYGLYPENLRGSSWFATICEYVECVWMIVLTLGKSKTNLINGAQTLKIVNRSNR